MRGIRGTWCRIRTFCSAFIDRSAIHDHTKIPIFEYAESISIDELSPRVQTPDSSSTSVRGLFCPCYSRLCRRDIAQKRVE